jgi:hypothetical protein
MRLKNNNNLSYLLALALSAGCGVTYADSLNGNGSMQNWNPSSLVVDSNSPGIGTPYWNNTSGDGSKENVGWCLAGGGNCTMPAGTPGNIPYYGNGSSSASMMYFTSSGSPLTLTLQTLLTTQTTTAGGYDIFGYYIANGSGSAASASLVPVFNSTTDKVGSTAVIAGLTPGENYGFYIENIQGSGTQYATNYVYFMDSASNTANGSMPADSVQHFAAFTSGNGTYFLGDVDGDACQGSFQPGTSPCVPQNEFDYNNLIVEVNGSGGANTPEPASLLLMGGGLCLLGVGMCRKRARSSEN